MLVIALALLVIATTAAVVFHHRAKHAEADAETQRTKAKVLIDSLGQRYQIKVADWGPDFTGQDGVLPRWRWVVVDADHALKMAFVPGYHERESEIRMLGNSLTRQDAHLRAMEWIEQQENPMLIVDGSL